jgi:hypothetical protein
MKLVKKFLGIVAVIAVIGFITLPLTGCPEDVDDGDKTVVPVGPSGISMEDAIPLTEGVWANGNISTANGEQWFKFTATAATQYIHFEAGRLISISVQLHDADGTAILTSAVLSGNGTQRNAYRTVEEGVVYYIKGSAQSGNSGTFKIAFNTSATLAIPLPTENITTLTENVWANGDIPANGEQWFKFTSTSTTQYIHFNPGTLNDMYVQLYDNTGVATGDRTNMTDSTRNISRTITTNSVYYIKVVPYSNRSGAYQIVFNTSTATPAITVTLPTENVTELTEGEWSDGNVTGEQWFKFTATASTQYIHFDPGTLSSVRIQLYDSTGTTTGDITILSDSTSRMITNGSVYYIKVWGGSGTYKIAFTTSTTTPAITLPTENVIELTEGEWADGNIPTNGEQWFKFTATASTQYIHFDPGTLSSVNIKLYDNIGTRTGNRTNLSTTLNTSRTVTNNSVYYINVASSPSYSGAYRIAFNTSTASPAITLPTENVTELTEGEWADGNIPTSDGEQWFKFTATASTQSIYFAPGALNAMYVQLYNDIGVATGNRTFVVGTTRIQQTVTNNSVYYIKVTPYGNRSGAYKIAFNTSSTAPAQ